MLYYLLPVQTIARNPLYCCAFLILISLATVFFRLGSLPLIGSDEPRYARIAQEMLQDHRWVTPTLEYKPWLEKPPLYYWITVPIYALMGMTEAAARMGPAALALMSALTILWLGARLWSRVTGLLAASILLTTVGYVGFARGASTDMPMTACYTAAMAILCMAAVEKSFAAWKVLPAYILLGLSVLAKGPVAIVLAGGTLLFFWLFDERGGSFHRWHVSSGAVVTAAASLPWFWLAFRENGFAFVATFFINHNLARYVTDIHHHEAPFFYYLPVLVGMFFPWTGWLPLLVPRSIASEIRGWRTWNPATLFLFCWVGVPLLFFSLSHSKLSGYILPVLPPLALLLGVGFAQAMTREHVPRFQVPSAWLYMLSSAAVAVAAPIVFHKSYGSGWINPGLLLSAAILAPALFCFYFAIKARWTKVFASALVQGMLVIVAFAQFAFPALGRYESAKEIARLALANDKDGAPIVTYRFFQHTLSYYTGYRTGEEFTDPLSLTRFGATQRRILIVTEAQSVPGLEELPDFVGRVLGVQGKLRLLELRPSASSPLRGR